MLHKNRTNPLFEELHTDFVRSVQNCRNKYGQSHANVEQCFHRRGKLEVG